MSGFEQTVGALGEGDLLLPAPFDLASASALARNEDTGRNAESLFAIDRKRPLHYRVHITAMSPDQPELGQREIVNTLAVGITPLVSILENLIDEIEEQRK